MDYNYNERSNEENGITISQIMQYVVRVVQKWWLVAICAVICASAGFVIAKVTYEPTYSTTARFAIDNKRENTSMQGQTSSDISAGILLAQNYKKIMVGSDKIMREVAKDCGYEITGDEVKNMIRASLESNTSIIEITFTSNDPDLTYAIATSYVNNYSKVTENAYRSTSANLFDEPVRPEKRNADNKTILYTLLGFVLGAFAVVFSICASIFIKDTLKSADDVTSKLKTKLLGQVVRIKKNDKTTKNLLISDKKTGFAFIESFKIIRAKIENISKRHGHKVFIFTSAYENEGKTTVTTNTALALAKSGKSVLLIDGDLRKPAIYKNLGVSATNELGLTGVINGERSLSDSIKYFEKFNLFLLITSQGVSDSAELLSSESMEEIISAVKNEFDYVIIDTSPAGVIADASIIAQYADACVMVARYDFAPSRRVKKTIDDIENTGTEVVGCVFNETEVITDDGLAKRGRRHRSYGYGHGYGYGYGYGHSYGYGYGYGYDDNKKSDAKKQNARKKLDE